MVGIPDEELLAGFAAGDADATRAFLARYRARVYGLALALLHDAVLAEDVAQEAFVRVWRHAASYDRRRGTVASWTLSITRNLAVDSLRRRQRAGTVTVEPDAIVALDRAATAPTAVEDAAVTADMASSVQAALTRLPPEQRRALVLAAYYGRTAEEISRTEGIPLGTAKTRILLALRKIRALLDTSEEPS